MTKEKWTFLKKVVEKFGQFKKKLYLCSVIRKQE